MHKVASSLLILLAAISAQAASIPITALPYTIVTPGTYVLAADLGNPTPTTDITINCNVPDKVLLNLNGHKRYLPSMLRHSTSASQSPATETTHLIGNLPINN